MAEYTYLGAPVFAYGCQLLSSSWPRDQTEGSFVGGDRRHQLIFHVAGWHDRKDGGATMDDLSYPHLNFAGNGKHHIDPGPKLDQSHTLPAMHPVSYLSLEDDAPRQETRNLREGNRAQLARNLHVVALIRDGRVRVHRVQIFAFLIIDQLHVSCNRGPIDVHIENVQEDA